ncbi:galactokinase [Aeromicrobium fastidiosum]|uniref:Galactokinase n=1 Tax=Aeromicrobium fastidiosum TaxID=52699 RepID=A0A641AJV1_9ACTN|nr:galactokinase [Aeromicrobium fastidiosum]KAA1374590.1 galactokinase [Aeromicrobium fastidiosum]MBP2390871.1 galactokinase [Aeromicrobium fastidiosum]
MTDVCRWDVPGRVNLIGEHLDYNGGPVLPLAIDRSVTVKARARDDGAVNVWSDLAGASKVSFAVTVQPGDVDGWASYVAGTIWALLDRGHAVPGADLVLESRLPSGAGLSSSAATTCGVASAIGDLFDLGLDRTEVALVAQHAEAGFVGAPVGLMDQLAVLHGTEAHGVLIDTAVTPHTTTSVELGWEADGLVLAVIATGAHHALADGEYAARREECERAAAELGLEWLAQAGLDATVMLADETLKARTRHVLTETARVRGALTAVNRRAWPQLGTILTASHASLRDDFEVSCPELDVAVEAALEAGALGARMTGGGFGGSAIALVAPEKVQALREKVEARYALHQWTRPEVFVVHAADGAHRAGPDGARLDA